MRKPTRKSLVRQLDKAFSDYIRERDGWRCVTCGEINRSMLQCGHLFSRVAYSTRWHEKNAACQCISCNLRHEYDPGPLTMHFLTTHDDAEYAELHRIHRTTIKYANADLERLIELYRNKRATLQLEEANAWK